MNMFEYVKPKTLQDVPRLLSKGPSGTTVIGGGTDLLDEIKNAISLPRQLISLVELKELQGVHVLSEYTRLGSQLTLTDLCENPHLRSNYPMLVEAAYSVATPQIRNIATVAGNLCQKPRCWYYRHPLFPCYKKGGTICYGIKGYNRNLAIIGGGPSFMVHPSDMAPALIALNAKIEMYSTKGFRIMELEEFFVGPEKSQLRENVLEPDEIVTSVLLPQPANNIKTGYSKIRDRLSSDFAVVSVAISLTINDSTISNANIILGGVAPIPYRAHLAEKCIAGNSVDDIDYQEIANLSVHWARPLQHNKYKVSLTINTVRRSLKTLLS